MWLCELHFDCYQETELAAIEPALQQFIDALRYNGQIIGREFPCALLTDGVTTRVVCPEPDSLHARYHSRQVEQALGVLHQAGLTSPKVSTKGQDLNSDTTDACSTRAWQVLYTTYLHSCSPVRCGEHLAPVPLYQLPAISNGDNKQIIKWQEDWEACDQLQMNGSILEHGALSELGDTHSRLSQRGRKLARQLEANSKIPTYYYLYRVGGETELSERQRPCPSCGGAWQLPAPLHDIFDFKCEPCRLVSNVSWDFKN
ncbi:Zn-ribbon-containing protein [Oceanisphaera avium]|uniref:Zn-ribbon-containing protein n=1 Tax=Oceanisphaera avium TaxID=1903694 RepID=A0A1Y0CWA9_9GAMM|nr:Zn-ribbon-containing protein [Oceanisphaera avium]ART79640.1 hypothetical protein CBP12_05300 [Oceanisphaera avium]